LTPIARRVFLSLGSNLGDRAGHLAKAIDSLPDVVAVSHVYETDPVGGPEQDVFLNIAVELSTTLEPKALLAVCHRIEANAERVREERWGPRTLDIDVIWVDGIQSDDPTLTLPHPRWMERRFVLAPLRDLAPELVSERDLQLAHGTVRRSATELPTLGGTGAA